MTPEDDSLRIRQRKAHRKSRLGCGNCKLRSIKCDESKPSCQRCTSTGYACNYTRATPALQLAQAGVFSVVLNTTQHKHTTSAIYRNDDENTTGSSWSSPHQPRPKINFWNTDVKGRGSRHCLPPLPRSLRIPVVLPIASQHGDYELRPQDFAALDRFRSRTIWTMGLREMRPWYNERAMSLASAQPFLLHIFIAFSLLHDTNQGTESSSSAAHRSSLAFHWYHAVALFHQLLATPSHLLSRSDRDALWVSASILGAAALAHMETLDPDGVWPMRAPSSVDLHWLKMTNGKRAVKDIAQLDAKDSCFYRGDQLWESAAMLTGHEAIAPDALPPLFYSLFDLASASPSTNPYYAPCSILATVMHEQIDDVNALRFLSFIMQLDGRISALLEEKDPRAMLLLAYWYAKVAANAEWWVRRRAAMEGVAICRYIDAHCRRDAGIVALMEFPRAVFGLSGKCSDIQSSSIWETVV